MSRAELTPEQIELLNQVTMKDRAWRDAKSNAAERIRMLVAEEIDLALEIRDLAVLRAVNAGLPKIELRRKEYGLHTKNANAVLEAIDRANLGLAA